jgi:hypothetical protein
MNFSGIMAALQLERDQIDQEIQALEQQTSSHKKGYNDRKKVAGVEAQEDLGRGCADMES